jgi:cysteine-rich repeat protein
VTPDGGTISGFTTPDVTFTGDLAVVGDADIFQIDLTQTGRLIVDVGTTAVTTCPSGTTTLRLFNNLGHELAFDNTDGPSSCSAFLATDLLDVPAGTYYVILEENGRNSSFAQYTIRFDVQAPPAYVCGDAFRNLTEQCDDGNVLGGDGCSPTCTLENAGFVVETEFNGDPRGAQNLGTLAPGQTVDVSASLYAADTDWFRFTLAGAASVRLNTYQTPGSTLTSCPMDSVMWLHSGIPGDYNATSSSSTNNQPTLVEYDDDDGNGSCSIISGTDTAPTARALTAGTYYVLVRRFGTAPRGLPQPPRKSLTPAVSMLALSSASALLRDEMAGMALTAPSAAEGAAGTAAAGTPTGGGGGAARTPPAHDPAPPGHVLATFFAEPPTG